MSHCGLNEVGALTHARSLRTCPILRLISVRLALSPSFLTHVAAFKLQRNKTPEQGCARPVFTIVQCRVVKVGRMMCWCTTAAVSRAETPMRSTVRHQRRLFHHVHMIPPVTQGFHFVPDKPALAAANRLSSSALIEKLKVAPDNNFGVARADHKDPFKTSGSPPEETDPQQAGREQRARG